MTQKNSYDWKQGVDFRWSFPPELMKDYYTALGRFMHEFALFEVNLTAIVANIAREALSFGLDYEKAVVFQTLTGAMRISESKDTMKRLFRVLNAQDFEIKELDRIFDQIGLITKMRNRIMHYGVRPDTSNPEGWFDCDNATAVKEWKYQETVSFKVDTIENMTSDMDRFNMLFHYLNSSLMNKQGAFPNTPIYSKKLYSPWQYTTAQLKIVHRDNFFIPRSRNWETP